MNLHLAAALALYAWNFQAAVVFNNVLLVHITGCATNANLLKRGTEYYRLDSDYVLVASFLYVNSRLLYNNRSSSKSHLSEQSAFIDNSFFRHTTHTHHHHQSCNT